MKFMLITAAILIFEAGNFYGENKVHMRKALKRARRELILKEQWRRVFDRCSWKHYHEGKAQKMLPAKNRCITYKHNGHIWDEFEFQKELCKEIGDNT